MALTLPVESVPAVPPLTGREPESAAPSNAAKPIEKPMAEKAALPEAMAV